MQTQQLLCNYCNSIPWILAFLHFETDPNPLKGNAWQILNGAGADHIMSTLHQDDEADDEEMVIWKIWKIILNFLLQVCDTS